MAPQLKTIGLSGGNRMALSALTPAEQGTFWGVCPSHGGDDDGSYAGAMPALGGLCGIPTCADHAARNESEISFDADSHRSVVRVNRAARDKAAGVVYVDIAVDEWLEPPWSRSQGPER